MISSFDRKKDKHLVQDNLGRNLTIALFKETNDGRAEYKPIWSLADWKEVYMDFADPTEYKAAIYLIGDWKHWTQLAEGSGVSPYIKEWRNELAIKLKAEGIEQLRKQAKSDKGTAAARWLAEQGFIDKHPKQRKAQEEVEAQTVAEDSLLRDTMKRLAMAKVG